MDVGGERHQEARSHGVDEGGALLDRLDLEAELAACHGGRHRLEPVGQAAARRKGPGQMALELRRTAEDDLHRAAAAGTGTGYWIARVPVCGCSMSNDQLWPGQRISMVLVFGS